MNKLLVVSLAALVALVSTAPAQAAGVVQVRFVEPQNFTDVRDGSYLLDQNLRSLERVVIDAAAPHVADGQTLTVDITDVDLAGYIHPGAMPRAVRLLRGGADWPRITLRWRLDGAAPRSGQAVVQDMAYLERISPPLTGTTLTYEKRMLRDYFRSQFDAASATH
jgi:hypothetical protein